MERATGEAQWKLTDLKWQPAQPQPRQTVFPSLRFQLHAAQKWEYGNMSDIWESPLLSGMQFTDTLPKWKQTLNVDYVKEIQLMRKMCAAERIETAWVSSISMFTFLEMTVTLFVHFRPLEKNQPTSYRWRDNLSYSCLKFLTGLLVIHIPQWHKSTWKTLWPWVWNSSMWQWHTEQSVMLFKIKRPHLKSGSR